MANGDNKNLFNRLVKEGKERIDIRGYHYVYQNKNILIPKFGKIAKKGDYTPFNEIKKRYANVDMNDHGAYRIALFLLNDIKVDLSEWHKVGFAGSKLPESIAEVPKKKKKKNKPIIPPVNENPGEDEDEDTGEDEI